MRLALLYSRANEGMTAPLVTVEAHLSFGLPRFNIVGLPETAVKESKDRVRSALLNTHFDFFTGRITVNLAPADLPKEGGRFDLPIALGILAASGQIPREKLSEYEFIGELALSGEVRAITGALPAVLSAKKMGRYIILPKANAREASLVKDANVFVVEHLLEVCAHLRGERELTLCLPNIEIQKEETLPDLNEVRGQFTAKRALEIAAAGCHSLLFIGPPGTGKTMLASRLQSILPPLTEEQALEIAALNSISSSGFRPETWRKIPFRSPHHSSSSAALVGGGRPPRPGEISLAHHGVLFLDELPEFSRQVLESLREPLESGQITISRAAYQNQFPAKFQLIAAMNPCPCGYAGSTKKECRCTEQQVQRYLNKLSGPLLDRIDMQVEVANLAADILITESMDKVEQSIVVKERVWRARHFQLSRQEKSNNALTTKEIELFCHLEKGSEQLLNQIMQKFNFSARVYHRIVKVARTIADLSENEKIHSQHISEALTYRCLDKAK